MTFLIVRPWLIREPGRRSPLPLHRAEDARRRSAQRVQRPARVSADAAQNPRNGEIASAIEHAPHADGPPAVEPSPVHRAHADRHQRRADQPADERVARARREPSEPRHHVPRDGSGEARADHRDLLGCRHLHDRRDGVCDRRPQQERPDHVADGGEKDGGERTSRSRGDERRDRVGGSCSPFVTANANAMTTARTNPVIPPRPRSSDHAGPLPRAMICPAVSDPRRMVRLGCMDGWWGSPSSASVDISSRSRRSSGEDSRRWSSLVSPAPR